MIYTNMQLKVKICTQAYLQIHVIVYISNQGTTKCFEKHSVAGFPCFILPRGAAWPGKLWGSGHSAQYSGPPNCFSYAWAWLELCGQFCQPCGRGVYKCGLDAMVIAGDNRQADEQQHDAEAGFCPLTCGEHFITNAHERFAG